jgi:hypothetical protein
MFGTLITHSGKGRRARVGAVDRDLDIGWEAAKEGSAYHGRVAAHAFPPPSLDDVIAT